MTSLRSIAQPLLAVLTIAIASGCAQTTRHHAANFFAPDPTRAQPVTAAMKADPALVHPGQIFEVVVEVRIAGGYHIYSTNATQGPFTPASLNLVLPQQLTPAGEWLASTPPTIRGSDHVYTGSVSFRRAIKVPLNIAEPQLSLKGQLLCQACSAELCWPPAKLEFSTALSILKGRKN